MKKGVTTIFYKNEAGRLSSMIILTKKIDAELFILKTRRCKVISILKGWYTWDIIFVYLLIYLMDILYLHIIDMENFYIAL